MKIECTFKKRGDIVLVGCCSRSAVNSDISCSVHQIHREKNMKKYISIDIGGTAIKYGMIEEKGTILERREMPTEAWKGGPSILEKVKEIVRQYCQKEVVSGICISTAGMVDTEKGEIFYAAPLIPDYAGIGFKKTLEQEFGIPCEVENDVNCAGLAEYTSGAAAGSRVMVMLTIGTGIGGCIVLNGEIFHGFGNSACEVGYMHMRSSDFQTLGAASILTKKVAEWKQEPAEEWSGYRIFEQARQGDCVCCRAIDEMADILGLGIANICYVLDPEVVVLGGGIMAQEDFLRDRIRKSLDAYLVKSIAAHVRIAFARHRNDAGMLGAFYNFEKRRTKKVE